MFLQPFLEPLYDLRDIAELRAVGRSGEPDMSRLKRMSRMMTTFVCRFNNSGHTEPFVAKLGLAYHNGQGAEQTLFAARNKTLLSLHIRNPDQPSTLLHAQTAIQYAGVHVYVVIHLDIHTSSHVC